MAVAVKVHSGTVDVGLGILAAAKALSLDFIPLMPERYDLKDCGKIVWEQ